MCCHNRNIDHVGVTLGTVRMKDTRLGGVMIRLEACPIPSKVDVLLLCVCDFGVLLRLVFTFIGTFPRETKQPTKKRCLGATFIVAVVPVASPSQYVYNDTAD